MAIDMEQLRNFQTEQLEQKNIEIVILLSGIGDSLKRLADKP